MTQEQERDESRRRCDHHRGGASFDGLQERQLSLRCKGGKITKEEGDSVQDINMGKTASRTKNRITEGRMKRENMEWLEENRGCAENETKPET